MSRSPHGGTHDSLQLTGYEPNIGNNRNQAFHPAVSWISRGKMTTVTQKIRTRFNYLEKWTRQSTSVTVSLTSLPPGESSGHATKATNGNWCSCQTRTWTSRGASECILARTGSTKRYSFEERVLKIRHVFTKLKNETKHRSRLRESM